MGSLRSNPQFVRLFVGRVVTNAGDSLYAIAAMWLVFDLTGSTLYTGVASFLTLGPQVLQFLAGPLVDRWSLRRVLVWTQAVQAVGVLAVPVAAATGHLTVWVVLTVMPILSVASQFDSPALKAALPHVVADDQLVRANSLFSAAGQSLDMTFNAASGVLVAIVGAVAIYLVDAATFVVAFALFLGLAVERERSVSEDERPAGEGERSAGEREHAAADDVATTADLVADYLDQLREGFDYLRGSAIASIVVGAVVVNFTFGVMMAVLPAFAESIGGPETYGLLMASIAAGNLGGSAVASLVKRYPLGRLSVACFAISAVCLFGAITVAPVSGTLVLFFAAFVPVGVFNVMLSSMLQSAVEESMLARASSAATSANTALMPVGSLVGGAVASQWNVRFALSVATVALGFLSVYFLVRPRLRRLPPVAEADEAVLELG